jgi:hypothetical protein
MRRRALAFGIILAITMWLGSRVNAVGRAETGESEAKVPSYDVRRVSIIEALRQLKACVGERTLLLTLEVAPFEREPEKNLTLSVANSTAKQVLDRITSLDPRYTYRITKGHVIHVYPRGAENDPDDLLNTRVKVFAISGIPYDRLLQYPFHYIPELGAEILRRSRAGGVVGNELSSTGVPGVTVEIQNGTVRDILNQVSLEAAKLSKSPVVPTGWVYTFRIDKSVPLGGHPHWELF